VQSAQNDVSDAEVRRAEIEGQLRQAHTMLVQRQEAEQDLNQAIQKLTSDRQSMQERITTLSRALANIETEKREMDRSHIRLEKDKTALKKTLDKVIYCSFSGTTPDTRSTIVKFSPYCTILLEGLSISFVFLSLTYV